MPASANTVWECRSTATAGNVNGGGFVTGASGTDYSQQNAAQYALTGIASVGSGNTFLTASAAANMVGNFARVVSGTNFTVGWFEITSVSAGVSVTCATNAAAVSICTGVGASGVINIGGSLSLGSTFDDDVFEEFIGGNTCWVRSGNYTLGESISIASASATGTDPIFVKGYTSTRGDNPIVSGTSQPVIAMGAFSISLPTFWNINYISFTTTAAIGINMGTATTLFQVKCLNTSTTSGRTAIQVGLRSLLSSCEVVCQNGTAVLTANLGQTITGCYIHDSATGISIVFNSTFVTDCVVGSCSSIGISLGSNSAGNNRIFNTTINGSSLKLSTGINMPAAASPNNSFTNVTISRCAVGISKTSPTQNSNLDFNVNFFDNTADTSNYTKSNTALALNPNFVDILDLTGTIGTSTGSVLTDTAADFSLVEDNVDYLRVVSGTGVTTGIYLITSHTATTLTVNNALGTSSAGDIVYVVPTGHNYAIGLNLRGKGTPSTFGSDTINYAYIGGVSVNTNISAAGGAFTFLG